MFKNYVLTGLRYFRRNKSYFFINVGGLSVGLASCLLIYFFLSNELSFDNFHPESENICRINTDYINSSGEAIHMLNTPPALAEGVYGNIPEVVKSTRLRFANRVLLSREGRGFYETQGFFADSVFLDIFNFALTSGDKHTALDAPNSIVMTEAMARKYFSNSEPLGQEIIMNNNIPLKVTGILNPVPVNSHINFDFLISFPTYKVPQGVVANLSSWRWLGFVTYVELIKGANLPDVEAKIDKLFADNTQSGQIPHKSHIQPLKNIYLGSAGLTDDLTSHFRSGNEFNIYSFAIIALMILLVAGFNFLNLISASSINRSREVGVRKVLGAEKSKLVFQMLCESGILVIISLVIAYTISLILFPFVKDIFDWDMAIELKSILNSLPSALVLTILLGMISALYPAFVLSGIKPVTALKGTMKLGKRGSSKSRNALIVLQFCISIGLIVSTLVITEQINFMREQKLGFEKENILAIKLLPENMSRYYQTFKNKLLQNSSIVSVSKSGRLVGDSWPVNQISVDGQDNSQGKQIAGNWVDFDYLKTMGITLKEGRTFSKDYSEDLNNSVIINEKAARYLGLKNPVGEKVWFFSFNGPRTIIGVVKDFNFLSLHNEISPAAMIMPFLDVENMYVRITPGNISDKIATLKDIWRSTAPGVPMEIHFMEDKLDQLYSKEEKFSNLISTFSMLALLLACLGLLGLVASMVNNRIKEVGIRKVLGASSISIIFIFIRQYVFIVAAAMILSFPAILYLLNKWLEHFAYRIKIDLWIFIFAGILTLISVLITVSIQVIKAATANPVKSLRYE